MENDESAEKLLNYLNSVHVTKEDIVRVIESANKEHVKGQDSEMLGLFVTARLFKKQTAKVQAIYFRMEALAEMVVNEELRGWTLAKLDDGSTPADDAVLAAVAQHPLSIVDGEITFERKSFLNRILEWQSRKEGDKSRAQNGR